MLAWTKQNAMQRAMRTVLKWPQNHATRKTINMITNKYEPQQKCRLGTVSKNKLLGGGLHYFSREFEKLDSYPKYLKSTSNVRRQNVLMKPTGLRKSMIVIMDYHLAHENPCSKLFYLLSDFQNCCCSFFFFCFFFKQD